MFSRFSLTACSPLSLTSEDDDFLFAKLTDLLEGSSLSADWQANPGSSSLKYVEGFAYQAKYLHVGEDEPIRVIQRGNQGKARCKFVYRLKYESLNVSA